MENKNKVKVYSLIIMIFISSISVAQKQVLNIDFQDHFSKDTLDVIVNNVEILKGKELTSHNVLGFAASTKISYNEGEEASIAYVDFLKEEITYSKNVYFKKAISISVFYKNKLYTKCFDFEGGMYFGVWKRGDNTIGFSQSKEPFIYE